MELLGVTVRHSYTVTAVIRVFPISCCTLRRENLPFIYVWKTLAHKTLGRYRIKAEIGRGAKSRQFLSQAKTRAMRENTGNALRRRHKRPDGCRILAL